MHCSDIFAFHTTEFMPLFFFLEPLIYFQSGHRKYAEIVKLVKQVAVHNI